MILVNVPKIYGKSVINIWEMLLQYMGKVSKIYGKCVRKYMVKVSLGSDTYPFDSGNISFIHNYFNCKK